MRLQFWAADTLRFSVTGPEPHRFLNRAAAAGVRLRRVRWQRAMRPQPVVQTAAGWRESRGTAAGRLP